MIKILISLFLTVSIFNSNCYARDNAELSAASINFNTSIFHDIGLKKQIREIHIEKVSINKSKSIDNIAAKKISKSLRELSENLYIDAKGWCPPPNDGPWEYEVKFDAIYYTDTYLSIVFNSFVSCYGNPIINKISKTYSTKNGNEVKPKKLIEEFSPVLLRGEISEKEDHIKLGEYALEFLLSENKNIFPENVESDCEAYLKNSYYSIWVRPGHLMLQPLFQHTRSICHKDLSVKFSSPIHDRKNSL